MRYHNSYVPLVHSDVKVVLHSMEYRSAKFRFKLDKPPQDIETGQEKHVSLCTVKHDNCAQLNLLSGDKSKNDILFAQLRIIVHTRPPMLYHRENQPLCQSPQHPRRKHNTKKHLPSVLPQHVTADSYELMLLLILLIPSTRLRYDGISRPLLRFKFWTIISNSLSSRRVSKDGSMRHRQ